MRSIRRPGAAPEQALLDSLLGHGRSAPLTSVAQWMSGLFGHADLTPSDLVAALVLTAAAQQQRRRLHIKSALDEKLGSITEASSDDTAGG